MTYLLTISGSALLSLWLAVALTKPRRPEALGEDFWLAWLRMENGWRLLLAFATLVSLSCVIAWLIAFSQVPNATLSSHRDPCYWEPQYFRQSPPPDWARECRP